MDKEESEKTEEEIKIVKPTQVSEKKNRGGGSGKKGKTINNAIS
jgi:hypothetical protein